ESCCAGSFSAHASRALALRRLWRLRRTRRRGSRLGLKALLPRQHLLHQRRPLRHGGPTVADEHGGEAEHDDRPDAEDDHELQPSQPHFRGLFGAVAIGKDGAGCVGHDPNLPEASESATSLPLRPIVGNYKRTAGPPKLNSAVPPADLPPPPQRGEL